MLVEVCQAIVANMLTLLLEFNSLQVIIARHPLTSMALKLWQVRSLSVPIWQIDPRSETVDLPVRSFTAPRDDLSSF